MASEARRPKTGQREGWGFKESKMIYRGLTPLKHLSTCFISWEGKADVGEQGSCSYAPACPRSPRRSQKDSPLVVRRNFKEVGAVEEIPDCSYFLVIWEKSPEGFQTYLRDCVEYVVRTSAADKNSLVSSWVEEVGGGGGGEPTSGPRRGNGFFLATWPETLRLWDGIGGGR